MSSYAELAPMAPAGKLELMLDQQNHGDQHLSLIAEQLDERVMENRLCTVLGLRSNDIRDISRENRDNPMKMRYMVKIWNVAVVLSSGYVACLSTLQGHIHTAIPLSNLIAQV